MGWRDDLRACLWGAAGGAVGVAPIILIDHALWNPTAAAWAQAVGTVLAIIGAFSLSEWQRATARRDQLEDRLAVRTTRWVSDEKDPTPMWKATVRFSAPDSFQDFEAQVHPRRPVRFVDLKESMMNINSPRNTAELQLISRGNDRNERQAEVIFAPEYGVKGIKVDFVITRRDDPRVYLRATRMLVPRTDRD